MKKIAVGLMVAFLFVVGVTVAMTCTYQAEDMGGSIIWTEGSPQV